MNTDRLVTYRTFDNYLSAEIMKGLLDSYNIPCFIIDENILYAFPAVNGIKLQIREGDIERVNEILKETGEAEG